MSRVPSLRALRALLVVVFALLCSAGSAAAVQTSTLTYKCKYPLIGIKSLSVQIELAIPDVWPTSTPTDPFSVVSRASAADMSSGLAAVDGLTSLDGVATAFATVHTAQGFNVPAKTLVSIPNTVLPDPVPDPLELLGYGSTPALTFDEPGVETVTLDRLAINLTARDSAGDPIVLPPVTKDIDGNTVSDSDGDAETFDVYCKLDPADQDTTIGTFEVLEATHGTPTPHPSPTGTPAPTPMPTPMPTPPPGGTPTPKPTPHPTPTPKPTPSPTPPPSRDTTPPTRPGALDIPDDDIGVTFLNVRWKASTDSGGSGLKEYLVEYGGGQVERVAATRTSIRLAGLLPDRTYSITITAVDLAGNESEPLRYTLRTRALTGGDTPAPVPTPTTPGGSGNPDPGGPSSSPTTAAKVRSVTFTGRMARPKRASRKPFVLLRRAPKSTRTPMLKVVLSRSVSLRITIAKRRGKSYKTLRGRVTVKATGGTTVMLRPTGSWRRKLLPRGTYRVRIALTSGAHDDVVLRFR